MSERVKVEGRPSPDTDSGAYDAPTGEARPQEGTTAGSKPKWNLWKIAPFILPVSLGLVWWVVSALELFREIVIPKPERVWKILAALWPILPDAWLTTMEMVGLGLLIGGVLGLGVGLSFGYSRWARNLLEFTTDAVRPIPLFALIPLFILWFGIGKTPQIALIATGVFLILTIHTTEAARNVPLIYINAALVSGASRFHIYRTVVIPAIVPHMLAAIRFAVMSAWGLDVAAEFMGSREGLGYIMLVRNVYLDTAGVVLIVLIFAFMAVVSDYFIRMITRRATRWSPRGEGTGIAAELIGRQ